MKYECKAMKIQILSTVISDGSGAHSDNYFSTRYRHKNSVALVRERKLYRLRDRRFSEKLVTILADRGCHVVSATDPHGPILGF
jgi:hypothetical protein